MPPKKRRRCRVIASAIWFTSSGQEICGVNTRLNSGATYLQAPPLANKYLRTVTKNCETCNEVFQASLKEHKRGNGRFCSLSCSGKRGRTPGDNCVCAWCQTGFYRSPSKKTNAKATGLQFCSRTCKDTAQGIGGLTEIQPPHYGTTCKSYRDMAFRAYPHKCLDCGYNKHAAVLEVHHLNGNREINDIENLVIVCPTCHTERHLGLRPNIDYKSQLVDIKEKMVEPVGVEPTTYCVLDGDSGFAPSRQ